MKKRTKIIVIVLGVIGVIATAQWISVQMALSYQAPGSATMACAEVQVRAINVYTGAIHTFSSGCSVAPGWVTL